MRRRVVLPLTEGMRGGGVDNGKPGLRSDYGPTYYAAFPIDPDGNNIEAVCMHEDSWRNVLITRRQAASI